MVLGVGSYLWVWQDFHVVIKFLAASWVTFRCIPRLHDPDANLTSGIAFGNRTARFCRRQTHIRVVAHIRVGQASVGDQLAVQQVNLNELRALRRKRDDARIGSHVLDTADTNGTQPLVHGLLETRARDGEVDRLPYGQEAQDARPQDGGAAQRGSAAGVAVVGV